MPPLHKLSSLELAKRALSEADRPFGMVAAN
jgi:hypothetical protein